MPAVSNIRQHRAAGIQPLAYACQHGPAAPLFITVSDDNVRRTARALGLNNVLVHRLDSPTHPAEPVPTVAGRAAAASAAAAASLASVAVPHAALFVQFDCSWSDSSCQLPAALPVSFEQELMDVNMFATEHDHDDASSAALPSDSSSSSSAESSQIDWSFQSVDTSTVTSSLQHESELLRPAAPAFDMGALVTAVRDAKIHAVVPQAVSASGVASGVDFMLGPLRDLTNLLGLRDAKSAELPEAEFVRYHRESTQVYTKEELAQVVDKSSLPVAISCRALGQIAKETPGKLDPAISLSNFVSMVEVHSELALISFVVTVFNFADDLPMSSSRTVLPMSSSRTHPSPVVPSPRVGEHEALVDVELERHVAGLAQLQVAVSSAAPISKTRRMSMTSAMRLMLLNRVLPRRFARSPATP